MKNITLNEKVVSKNSSSGFICFTATKLFGTVVKVTVVKVNEKSFRVLFTKEKVEEIHGVRVVKSKEYTCGTEVTYRLWKEADGKSYYAPTISGGRVVYGIITK